MFNISDRTRFRFPWSTQQARPTQSPTRPQITSQRPPPAVPTRPVIPSQRPPPPQPQEATAPPSQPPQTQIQETSQTRPERPSQFGIGPQTEAATQAAPKPPSPSRRASQLPSPSRRASQPPSPSRASRQVSPPQPSPKTSPQRTSKNGAAQAQPQPQSISEPSIQTQAQPQLQSISEPSIQAQPQPKPQSVSEPSIQPQPRPESISEPSIQPRPESISEPSIQPQPLPQISSQAQAEPSSQTQPQPQPIFEPSIEPQPLSQISSQVQAEPSSQPQPQPQPQTTTQLMDQATTQPTSKLDEVVNQPIQTAVPEVPLAEKPTIVPKGPTSTPESSKISYTNAVPEPPTQLPKASPESETEPRATQDGKPELVQESKPKEKLEDKLLEMVSSKPQPGPRPDTKSQQTLKTKIAEQKRQEKQMIMDEREAATTRTKRISLSSGDAGAAGKGPKLAISIHPKDKNVDGEMHPRAVTTVQEENAHQKQIREGISRFINKLTEGQLQQLGAEPGVQVITLAGENRGASMHIGSSSRKDSSLHIHRGYRLNKDNKVEPTSEEEESPMRNSKPKGGTSEPITACVNSNIQSINNSILYGSTCSEKSPGVHLSISDKQPEPVKPKEKKETIDVHRSDFNVTPSQKLTSDSNIRRRCLRGLFMESSESDPENPEKPRRHGCRYNCPEGKDRDKNEGPSTSNK